MRLPHYLILRPGGYAFRFVVPQSLRAILGRRVVKHALRTHDRRTAQAWALVLANRYRLAFQRLERGTSMKGNDKLLRQLTGMTPAQIDEIGRVAPDDGREVRPPPPRQRQPTPDEEMAEAFGLGQDGDGRTYTVKIDPATGRVVEASSDGSEADNAGLLDALRVIGQQTAAQVMPAPTQMLPATEGPPNGVKAKALKAAVDDYLAHYITPDLDPLESKRRKRAKPVLAAFVQHAKPKIHVYAIHREICGEFLDEWRHQSNPGKPLENGTLREHQRYLENFFSWAAKRGYFPAIPDYPPQANPAWGHVKVSERDKRKGRRRGWKRFDDEQLRVIFNLENFEALRNPRNRWLVLLALYTGARSNELARLELRDIKQFKGWDGWLLDFNAEGEYKSIKNEDSERKTPIHSDLVELGFLERVDALRAAGERYLFPDLNQAAQNGPAGAVGHAFSRCLDAWGVGVDYGRVGLHSFRKVVVQTLFDSSVRIELRQLYVGHDPEVDETNVLESDHMGAYSTLTAKVLAQVADACHPKLDWAAQGVIDIAALRPLLVEKKKAPNPRHFRKPKKPRA